MGFEDSLSRAPERLAILLLIHAMAAFAAWLLARAVKAAAMATDPLTDKTSHRARYSEQRRCLEWLRHRRQWPPELLKMVRKISTEIPG
jgi:hypothetical protein